MTTIKLSPGALPLMTNPLPLGIRGENEITQIEFDFAAWADAYGSGVVSLLIRRPGDSAAYPVTLAQSGTTAVWTVTATDLAARGRCTAEYAYTVGAALKKSCVFYYFVAEDIGSNGPAPDPYEEWLATLTELAAETQQAALDAEAASEAIKDMSVEAEALEPGAEPTVTKTVDPETGAVTLVFGLPEGGGGGGAVTSVNGKTGTVVLSASDVGALPSDADLDDIPDGTTYKRATAAQLAQIAANADDVAALENVVALNGIAVPIPMTDGYYIKLNDASGYATPNTPTAQGGTPTRYAVVPCAEGDVFTVNATGGTAPRAWGFTKTDGEILSVAVSGADVNGLVLTAPANAAYFIVNDTSFTKTSYVGQITKDALATAIFNRRQLYNTADLNDITQNGTYYWTYGNGPANRPVTSESGILIVHTYGALTVQHFCSASYAFSRTLSGGTWGEWTRSDFGTRRRLTSSDDLNSVTVSGIYEYTGNSAPANAPSGTGGVVVVFTMPITGGLTVQAYYNASASMWRVKSAVSGWQPWSIDAGTITELPILTLTGDTSTMSKDNAVTLDYSLFGQTGTCTCKWQGSSSQRYPKKNYTIKFSAGFDGWYQWAVYVNARRALNGNISEIPTTSRWGTQTKYCAKANWVDPSAIRNIVCARLWGQIVKARVTAGDVDDGRSDAPNYGAIDGFPCEIRINGVSAGLYTLNIPKGAWQFAFGSGQAEYLVSGEDNASQACRWKALAELDGTDYSVEYAPDGVEDSTIRTSLNAAIQAAINAGSDWETTLAPYLDIDSVFDYFIFTCCVNNHDALARNILYGTYDGTRWFMSAYDLDTTFGVDPYGTSWFPVVNDRNQFAEAASIHRLAYLAYTYSKPKLAARYQTLRNGILSDENVWRELSNLAVYIPTRDYDLDRDIWTNAPGTATADISQYMDYYRMHCAYLDEELLGSPYPVTSVNGQTGAVVLAASDVGAVPTTDYAPESKTLAMTQAVGKDSSGKLWTADKVFVATYGTTSGQAIYDAMVNGAVAVCYRGSNDTVACVCGDAAKLGTGPSTFSYKAVFLGVGKNGEVKRLQVIDSTWTESSVSLAPLDSPALTGHPTAPTQTSGDNSTKIATTAFVEGEISGKADSDLGVSGASVGQYVKIKTVDGSGKPTSFEPGTPSGGGGTSDYDDLTDKPQINGVTLSGNKSAADLGLAAADDKANVIISATSGDVASFPDGMAGAPVSSLAAAFGPVQAGSGNPGPTNVREISGRTGLTINHSGADTSNPNTVTVSWQSEAGTVYGGTVDFAAGVLTVEYARYPLSSFTWGKSSVVANAFASIDSIPEDWPAATNSTSLVIDALSDIFRPVSNGIASESAVDNVMSYRVSSGKQGLLIRSNSLSSVYSNFTNAALQAALSGHYVVYRKRTPTTVQLTAQEIDTLLGVNQFWTGVGTVAVTYRADTKLYIAKLTGQTGDTLVADANIASGKYFVIGNRLFLSTASIASGAAVVPGTNCTETNLAAALNAINT